MTLDVLHVDGGNDDSNLILHNKFLLLSLYPQVLVTICFFYAENGKKLVFIPHDNSNLPINNNNWCATFSREKNFFNIQSTKLRGVKI